MLSHSNNQGTFGVAHHLQVSIIYIFTIYLLSISMYYLISLITMNKLRHIFLFSLQRHFQFSIFLLSSLFLPFYFSLTTIFSFYFLFSSLLFSLHFPFLPCLPFFDPPWYSFFFPSFSFLFFLFFFFICSFLILYRLPIPVHVQIFLWCSSPQYSIRGRLHASGGGTRLEFEINQEYSSIGIGSVTMHYSLLFCVIT